MNYRALNLHRHFLFSEFLDLTLADKVDLRSSAAGNTVSSANQANAKLFFGNYKQMLGGLQGNN